MQWCRCFLTSYVYISHTDSAQPPSPSFAQSQAPLSQAYPFCSFSTPMFGMPSMVPWEVTQIWLLPVYQWGSFDPGGFPWCEGWSAGCWNPVQVTSHVDTQGKHGDTHKAHLGKQGSQSCRSFTESCPDTRRGAQSSPNASTPCSVGCCGTCALLAHRCFPSFLTVLLKWPCIS